MKCLAQTTTKKQLWILTSAKHPMCSFLVKLLTGCMIDRLTEICDDHHCMLFVPLLVNFRGHLGQKINVKNDLNQFNKKKIMVATIN